MKIVQVFPRDPAAASLKSQLKATERALRGGTTTFVRKREGRWVHKRYPGSIRWSETLGGILVAEVSGRGPDHDWQLLSAFIGYLDRHLGDAIDSISVFYR
ncbi:MAG: hypothetical protein ACREL5_09770 [Gemmatimonadales bacterium]